MTRKAMAMNGRGYFGVGVFQPKTAENVGVLWRGAYQLGAEFLFTIGRRYSRQASDTPKTWRHMPLFHYESFETFRKTLPMECLLVAVEMDGAPLHSYQHPERCIYLLGAEDHGLPVALLERCHQRVSIEAIRAESYNVAQAGTLVMYERARQRGVLKGGRDAGH